MATLRQANDLHITGTFLCCEPELFEYTLESLLIWSDCNVYIDTRLVELGVEADSMLFCKVCSRVSLCNGPV